MTQSVIPTNNISRLPTHLPPLYANSSVRANPSNPPTPSTLTNTTTLLIGPDLTPFHIHTSLLLASSPYFRACLVGPFLESTQGRISLADVSPSTFSLLTTYLYTSRLPPPLKRGKPAYYALLRVYALADRLCIEGLRNCVVDTLCELAEETNSVLTPSDTRVLYSDVIREGAPLRDLVLDLFAYMKTERLVDRHEDEWHAGFLRDLVVRLKTLSERAMTRHRLGIWWPESWAKARACEACRVVLGPRRGAVRCKECGVAFCKDCVERSVGVVGWDGGRRGEGKEQACCRPWRGARCAFYHEHKETERCADVLIGKERE